MNIIDRNGRSIVTDDLGAHYFNALDLTANQDGPWFSTGRFRTVGISVQLALGVGTITGKLFAEYTADPDHLMGVSRVVLPPGCLHTDVAGVVLASPGLQVDLTAVTSGSLSVTFKCAAGDIRFRWAKTGGSGAAPNTISGVVQAHRNDE